MTEKPEPLLFEDSFVVVPVHDAAQRVFEDWFRTKHDELMELMKPFGYHSLGMPTLERVVFTDEPRLLGPRQPEGT